MRKRRKKPKRRKRLWICVDPGVAGTGIAVFSVRKQSKFQMVTVLKSPTDKSWLERCFWITARFSDFLYGCSPWDKEDSKQPPITIYMETPNVWLASERGYAAAASGDLLRLSALIGMLAVTCWRLKVKHDLKLTYVEVPVNKWKGQLSKAVVKKRVMEAFGLKKIPNHAADAAGIGLWVAGRM